ncbi:hypothetical protein HHK36_019312 [Tetracentron sinense]|uniref:HPt domain-containing protein n=1 Tax=Tetracentron sinense TaxID=13715 RepID=A0A834YZ16_TETSI|nr:hypothetical protein HHK36_019312 [Tetracentron sinense]
MLSVTTEGMQLRKLVGVENCSMNIEGEQDDVLLISFNPLGFRLLLPVAMTLASLKAQLNSFVQSMHEEILLQSFIFSVFDDLGDRRVVDYHKVAEKVHKLKGSSSSIGAYHVYLAFLDLRQACEDNYKEGLRTEFWRMRPDNDDDSKVGLPSHPSLDMQLTCIEVIHGRILVKGDFKVETGNPAVSVEYRKNVQDIIIKSGQFSR